MRSEHTSAVLKALDEGAYAQAEAMAAQWKALVGTLCRVQATEASEATDLLVEAGIANGNAAERQTLELAENEVSAQSARRPRDALGLARALHNLGVIFEQRGEFNRAGQVHYREVFLLRTSSLTIPALSDALDALARVLIDVERFHEAESALDESLAIRRVLPADDRRLARTLSLQAHLFQRRGEYDPARSAVDRALLSIRNAGIDEGPEAILPLRLSGELQAVAGNFVAAERDWQQALMIAQETLRPEHPVFAHLERLLAVSRRAQGDLRGAADLLERADRVGERSLAPCHDEVAALLNDRAELAADFGDYHLANQLYDRASGMQRRCHGTVHTLTATGLHNKGLLAAQMGDWPAAVVLQQEAVRIWTATVGPHHQYVARGLDALADARAAQGEYLVASRLYERALNIRRASLGSNHPDVAWTLTNLAHVLAVAGYRERAATLVLEAIEIYGKGAAPFEPDHLARAYLLKGRLDAGRGDYATARASVTEALVLREKTFGADHPLAGDARANLASLELATDRVDEALSLALAAEKTSREHFADTIRFLSESQAMAYAAIRTRGLDVALSIATDRPDAAGAASFDAVIRSRGVVLDELASRGATENESSPELAQLQAAVASAREQFANLLIRSVRNVEPVPRGVFDAARTRKEDAERALIERSSSARAAVSRSQLGIDDVRRAMPANSAMVSFVRYDKSPVGRGQPTEPRHQVPSYLAFVERPGGTHVDVVPLGSARAIDHLIESWHQSLSIPSGADGVSSAAAVAQYRKVATQLRTRVWDPVVPSVNGADHVFLVPDGAINLVSFAALPTGRDRYLLEDGPTIHYLSAERDVVPLGSWTPGSGLLAVGGPAFDRAAPPKGTPQAPQRRSLCGSLTATHFESLPGAKQEAASIAAQWRTARLTNSVDGEAMLLTGTQATETAVKQRVSGRRVVHFATHAFVVTETCGTPSPAVRAVGAVVSANSIPHDVLTENPLSLSGLAFAGANVRSPTAGGDDGILTGEEVAGLNLQGTEWAVLSACDTGIGKIEAGEGVFGLRRAFQIAGARTVIMSLWSVDDDSTRDWMQLLYEARLARRSSTAEAVKEASLTVLKRRRSHGQSTHPFYWAAFVASGDWR